MSTPYRILLVKPRQNIVPYAIEPPLGVMYLASYLRQQQGDIELGIIDMTPENMNYAQLADRMRSFNPDLVGITALTVESRGLHRTAALAKQLRSDTIVVAGGPHASAYPQKVMMDPHFDYVVVGEGELTFNDFVTAIREGGSVREIDGLVYRDNGQTKTNPRQRFVEDLDSLPFPA